MLLGLRLTGVDPYVNLATERWLTDHLDQAVMLMLWQNKHTVVIGKNQNPLRECRLSELFQDHGRLARRCSGGGAVYHDLGNLNFTIITPSDQFDVKRQSEVILQAVRSLGIEAKFSGRNDLLARGRKFSGSAFYHGAHNSFHHGTLLWDTDSRKMMRYLQPEMEKLRANGVDSVVSRVINLRECCPQLTLRQLCEALEQAMEQVYGQPLQPYSLSEDQRRQIEKLAEIYQSKEWLFPPRFHADLSLQQRFEWGSITLQLALSGDQIIRCGIDSDAMAIEPLQQLQQALSGCPLQEGQLQRRLAALPECEMIQDCRTMILQQLQGRKDQVHE